MNQISSHFLFLLQKYIFRDGWLLGVSTCIIFWRVCPQSRTFSTPTPGKSNFNWSLERQKECKFKFQMTCAKLCVSYLVAARGSCDGRREAGAVVSVLLLRSVRVWPLRVVVAQLLARGGGWTTREPTYLFGGVTAAATEVRTDDRRTRKCIFDLYAFFLERSIANYIPVWRETRLLCVRILTRVCI